MFKSALPTVVLSAALTAIGLAGGWYAARKPSAAAPEAGPAEEGGAEHAAHEPAKPKLSPQALKNMGVTTAEAQTSAYSRFKTVPAVVAASGKARLPLYSPVSGRVLEISTNTGMLIKPGTAVVKIVRDPFPRPTLVFTAPILPPALEEFHKSISELRKAVKELELQNAELARITPYIETGDGKDAPLLPRKNLIDLKNEIAKTKEEINNTEVELKRHGLTPAQIAELKAGNSVPTINEEIWKHGLEQNGLWTDACEKLFASLPAAVRESPWTIAAIGELAVGGQITPEFSEWVKSSPVLGIHFLEIAGLMQQGHSLPSLKRLAEQNAFEAIVEVSPPIVTDADDWDVAALSVKPGEKVEAGKQIGEVANHRRMILKSDPVGAETASLLKALDDKSALEAVPLIPNTGLVLKEIQVLFIDGDDQSRGSIATMNVNNKERKRVSEKEGEYRTWELREGMRYLLRVPVETWSDAYVLPSQAVADDGTDKVVFIQNGDSFEPKKVVLLYQDNETAVLDSKHSDLFAGDTVVTRGAFELSLALKAGDGGGEEEGGEEGGHHHHHHHH